MDIKYKRILLFCSIIMCFVPLYSQKNAVDQSEKTFYFEIKENEPEFVQIIRWPGDPAAFGYIVIVAHMDGTIFLEEKTQKNMFELRLPPGEYSYQIAIVNFLDQIEYKTERVKIIVERAYIPKIIDFSPRKITDTMRKPILRIQTPMYEPDWTITFFKIDDPETSVTLKPQSYIDGIISVAVNIDNFPSPGLWGIRILHPSGLEGISSDELELSFVVAEKPIVEETPRIESPVEIALSFHHYIGLRWTPILPFIDNWYVTKWNDKFYPVAGAVYYDFVTYINNKHGVGVDIQLTGQYMPTTFSASKLIKVSGGVTVSFLYEYFFIPSLSITARAGTGGVVNFVRFSRKNDKGLWTLDVLVSGGIGLRWFFYRDAFVDITVDWEQVFYRDLFAGSLIPGISIGYRF